MNVFSGADKTIIPNPEILQAILPEIEPDTHEPPESVAKPINKEPTHYLDNEAVKEVHKRLGPYVYEDEKRYAAGAVSL
jgi:hypothetical protein